MFDEQDPTFDNLFARLFQANLQHSEVVPPLSGKAHVAIFNYGARLKAILGTDALHALNVDVQQYPRESIKLDNPKTGEPEPEPYIVTIEMMSRVSSLTDFPIWPDDLTMWLKTVRVLVGYPYAEIGEDTMFMGVKFTDQLLQTELMALALFMEYHVPGSGAELLAGRRTDIQGEILE
jgi:hypothetical protein